MRILLVSNRLPIIVEKDEQGNLSTRQSSGGLVTALAPGLKRWGGMWIGWPGSAGVEKDQWDALLADFSKSAGYALASVPLAIEDYKRFYEGYCNQIIWPLFHDLQSLCNFQPEFWAISQKVHESFADVVEQNARPEDFIWVHDYHLIGLGQTILKRGLHNKIGFFLHIPFPPPDIFAKLPWRKQVLKSLLQYDLIGLQTRRDLRNFTQCVMQLLPEVKCWRTTRQSRMTTATKTCVAGVFPIGIDYESFAGQVVDPGVIKRVEELRKSLPDRQIILGVDRLDYTKGVPQRLKAFALALERYPELHKKVTLFQVVVPSREMVPQYQDLKAEIELLVGQINGKFTQPGWVPIHHVFRHVDRQDLLAWYRVADAALVTSLKDGMNLVAKEYCACQIDGNGVLVLSEFAGAAEQLGRWAILVNPYDIDCVADAIKLAMVMTPEERRPAMEKLRANIRQQDVFWWLAQFLRAAGTRADAAKELAANFVG